MGATLTIRHAAQVAGSLGYPSKMPGTSYGISAHACHVGAKLAQVAGSTCHGCYALKANYQYPSVAQSHAKRLEGIASPEWVAAMVAMLTTVHARGTAKGKAIAKGWHRWHDSGDIQSVEHLAKICQVAKATPKIRHWLPTREIGLLTQYVKSGGEVPANLLIRVSATMVDGAATKAWPHTSGVHHNAPAQGRACPAPDQNNECGKCRACWSKNVAHVSYHKH